MWPGAPPAARRYGTGRPDRPRRHHRPPQRHGGQTLCQRPVGHRGRVGTITVDGAHIADGAIDSTKFADTIQSDPFEPGRRGWRIQRDGRAEFNDVVLSRQLQADSGSLDLRAIQVRRTTGPAIAASWIVETARSIDAWDGARWTYLATAGLDNTSIESEDDNPTDALFGVQATALALTRWGGGQRLRLKLDLWTQKVTAVRPKRGGTWRIDWRLYQVT